MHAILLQMAIIPLTMARFTIASLSPTWLRCYLPLNRAVNIHIFMGYLLVSFVCLATLVFVLFFGIICASGDESFCAKFTSTIMVTGYVILIFILVLAVTSHLRHIIPYEVFYLIHHSVFILYALTIAHTLDGRGSAQTRSQTFKWFSIPILYYVCDRCAMHFFHSYRTRLASCSSVIGPGVEGSHGSRLLLVKLYRPPLFEFHPGQYAYLKVAKIDPHWHPFSIASEPASDYLEFYIECCGINSWTDKLWNMIQEGRLLEFEVQGPVGTILAQTQEYSHAIAIGTGTGKSHVASLPFDCRLCKSWPLYLLTIFFFHVAGIVPVLSLFKQHVRKLLRLDPCTHFQERRKLKARVAAIERAQESRKGSLLRKILSSTVRREKLGRKHYNRTDALKQSIKTSLSRHDEQTHVGERNMTIKEYKRAAFQTTRSIYGVALLAIFPVFGISLIGFTISWNTLTIPLPVNGMFEFLQWLTVIFQVIFLMMAVTIWDANSFFAYTDATLSVLAPFFDWYWFWRPASVMPMTPANITTYCLLTAYMTARAWSVTVKPRSQSWRNFEDGWQTLERLDIVWASRSASLVSEIIPDINAMWQDLVNAWGLENAKSVCRFNVFVTDKDETAKQVLRRELAQTILYQNGFIHFGRPDFDKIIEDHSIEMIDSNHTSNTLLAYVGSPQLAAMIHECKMFNDMKVAITGNKKHQMDFVSESYGGVKSCKPEKPLKEVNVAASFETPSSIGGEDLALSTRHTVSFAVSEHIEACDDCLCISHDIGSSPRRTMESPASSDSSEGTISP